MLDRGAVPYQRALGTEIGRVYRDLHVEHGVDVRSGVTVAELTGDHSVTGARLTDGTTVQCDLAVVGIGVLPRTTFAEDAGLAMDNGIAVNERLKTSDPNVFAAGDAANAFHPTFGRRVRLEHW